MRKYNEGYTLPFVLVVFLVTSLVAVSILTVSIHNLHGQKASIHRMEAQYTAQGEIEKVGAILRDAIHAGELDLSLGILTADLVPQVEDTVLTPGEVESGGAVQALELRAETTKGTLRVTAVFRITGTSITPKEEGVYKVKGAKIEIASYTVDTIEPTTEESAGGPQ